jgi:2-haloalkanoic acid dehalogenase type II
MTRAVLLDALGTLVELRPPAPKLRALLAAEGVEVSEEHAAAAFGAEVDYYLAHHMEGRDEASLEDLRERCTVVLREALGLPARDQALARQVLADAVAFDPYPDAAPALRALRARGVRLVVASNWDSALSHWLGETGLLELLDGVVTSAHVGAAKPDAAVFEAALSLAGAAPEEAVHVGDSLVNDVEGAHAAGLRALLVVRGGDSSPAGVETIPSLAELPALV